MGLFLVYFRLQVHVECITIHSGLPVVIVTIRLGLPAVIVTINVGLPAVIIRLHVSIELVTIPISVVLIYIISNTEGKWIVACNMPKTMKKHISLVQQGQKQGRIGQCEAKH